MQRRLKTCCDAIAGAPKNEGQMEAWVIQRLRTRGILPVKSKKVQSLYVNHGRWVVACSYCNNTIVSSPRLTTAICLECGTAYKVEVPEDWDAIEEALVVRPIASQNWTKETTVEELLAENQEHHDEIEE